MTDYTASFRRLRKNYDFRKFGDEVWESIPNKNADKIRWSACVWNVSLEKAKKKMAMMSKTKKKPSVNEKRNQEIIKMIDEGYTRKEVAEIMKMSVGGVGHILIAEKGTGYKTRKGGMTRRQAVAYSQLHEQIKSLSEEGYSAREIGEELAIAKSTVYTHLKRIRIEEAFGEENGRRLLQPLPKNR
ncbi:hypothetical protein [Ligilactobacillus equi]|uniref:Resolvase HTH domain-containing protein n=1 Tax=Ligilactobacillus equi DSM 15833 = JCM 10991 TaxID=1423740 RepID=A0A0R1T631_9LACO|nr:hypothetical protein [Ligilactobacillus equi]KRL76633.1 hypothetical protein FC36_GL001874 [Ligilactobacillus equi DSM 15833 = JCM 10991]